MFPRLPESASPLQAPPARTVEYLASVKSRAGRASSPVFHIGLRRWNSIHAAPEPVPGRENRGGRAFSAMMQFSAAPFPRHAPVDAPHLADFTQDIVAAKRLTVPLARVDCTRSLTTSNVFPVGAASGAQARSRPTFREGSRTSRKGAATSRWPPPVSAVRCSLDTNRREAGKGQLQSAG